MIDELRAVTRSSSSSVALVPHSNATAQLPVSSRAQCIRCAKNGADETEEQRLLDTFVKLLERRSRCSAVL
jgi:hypothetical protein